MSALVELLEKNESEGRWSAAGARVLLERVKAEFDKKPFVPHRLFRQGDAQTIGAHFWPRRIHRRAQSEDEPRLFEVETDARVLSHCRWQAQRASQPTLVAWHGMEGSTSSGYMLSVADKAYQAGFNVVRVNLRNCGATEHLTSTLYHAGQTGDLRAVIDELIKREKLSRLFLAGFSLGGNLVLKVAGEYGDDPPPEIKFLSSGALEPNRNSFPIFTMRRVCAASAPSNNSTIVLWRRLSALLMPATTMRKPARCHSLVAYAYRL